ncbi:hypothetical protein JOC55_003579 [Paenibacillus sacheonensis]|nr:hypothetical protein [Paenibacillus sacheonensis]
MQHSSFSSLIGLEERQKLRHSSFSGLTGLEKR